MEKLRSLVCMARGGSVNDEDQKDLICKHFNNTHNPMAPITAVIISVGWEKKNSVGVSEFARLAKPNHTCKWLRYKRRWRVNELQEHVKLPMCHSPSDIQSPWPATLCFLLPVSHSLVSDSCWTSAFITFLILWLPNGRSAFKEQLCLTYSHSKSPVLWVTLIISMLSSIRRVCPCRAYSAGDQAPRVQRFNVIQHHPDSTKNRHFSHRLTIYTFMILFVSE